MSGKKQWRHSCHVQLLLVGFITVSTLVHNNLPYRWNPFQRDQQYRDIDMLSRLPTAARHQQKLNVTFHVLGERNSGTNLATSLLQLLTRHNRQDYTHNLPNFIGGKHMFARDDYTLEQLDEISSTQWKSNHGWILAVREPCSWLDAMWRRPYHMCPRKMTKNCSETNEDQGTQEWSQLNRREFLRASPFVDYAHGGRQFKTVFGLRAFKLEQMQRLMHVLGPEHYKVVHFPDAQVTPQAFLHEMKRQFVLPISTERLKGLIPRGFVKQTKTVRYPKEEYDIVVDNLDWELEAMFGFTKEDCHLQ